MFAGVIVLALGVHFLFPEVWEYISGRLNLASRSGQTLQTSAARDSYWGDVVVGLALGPVLNSCSPTYLLIVGVILPQDLAVGTVHLLFYTLGLALALLAIGLLGQRVATKLRWMADPHGRFRIIVGTVLVLFGVLILSGVDKVIESYLIENQSGFYQVLVNFEVDALESL
jgi:cytochrome c biogenesis protein CcdA